MRYGLRLALFLIVSISSVAQDQAAADDGPPSGEKKWIKHRSPDGTFEVLFPGKAIVSRKKDPTGKTLLVAQVLVGEVLFFRRS